ncbi:CUZD1 protein, partial [Centropus bengalensis]|nr:CUZD1 protein [Centropus bengalensis]
AGAPRCGTVLHDPNKSLEIKLNASASCVWQIQRNTDQKIRLVFSYFKFAPSSSCETESITIFDGPSSEAPVLGRVCNETDAVPVLQSSSDSLTFLITTNPQPFTRSFFVFYYYFSPGKGTENCGGELTGPNGTFTTPNYPAAYPPFTYCVWHIRTPENTRITLHFKDLFLELDQNCRFDFTAVYNGLTTNTGLIGKVCGLAQPTFDSSSNAMTVVLLTDYANSYRGFSARYSSAALPGPAEPDGERAPRRGEALPSSHHKLLPDPPAKDSPFPSWTVFRVATTEKMSFPFFWAKKALLLSWRRYTLLPGGMLLFRGTQDKGPQSQALGALLLLSQSCTNSLAGSRVCVPTSPLAVVGREPLRPPCLPQDLNQTLFAEVSLHSTDPNLLVFVDTCIASPQPDFGSLTYDLIRSGCSKDDTVVTFPPLAHHGRFKFSAFRFLRSSPSVYLQCEMLICDSNTPGSRCTEGCTARQKRAVSSYQWKTSTTVGPIRLKRDLRAADPSDSRRADTEGTPSLHQYSFYTLSFLVLLSNIIIVVAVILKYHSERQPGHGYHKLQSS